MKSSCMLLGARHSQISLITHTNSSAQHTKIRLPFPIRYETNTRRMYRLLDESGCEIISEVPGTLGGYRVKKVYGRLDCWAAVAALPNYSKSRVFFLDEATAIAAGYRPCAKCMKNRYNEWNKGGIIGSTEYPWFRLPPRFSKRNDVAS